MKAALLLAFLLLLASTGPQAGGDVAVVERLDRIQAFLESGNPNQKAAARRQLQEQIGLGELEELRAFLNRQLPPEPQRILSDHLEELLFRRLGETEQRVVSFESLRRVAREQSDRLPVVPDDDDVQQLAETRRSRDEARQQIREDFRFLARQGLALASPLWLRRQTESAGSALVHKMRDRLQESILEEVERVYPRAPGPGSLSLFERRALVPLTDSLAERDPEGWERFRREIAREGIELFTTLRPESIREARRVFLQLGDWGVDRLEEWRTEGEALTPELRRVYAEWNLLGVPPGFPESTGLDLAGYRGQNAVTRQEVIYRLEWVGGSRSIPILVKLLTVEESLPLRIEAAGALARLRDPRGADFLRSLGLARALELESISRQVLLIEAIHRRESGDLNGAIEDFQDLLKRYPADHRLHYELAYSAHLAQRFDLAIRHYRQALTFEPNDSITLYNLACAYAMSDQPEPALDALERAVESGFRDRQQIESDPELESLRGRLRYRALLQRLSNL